MAKRTKDRVSSQLGWCQVKSINHEVQFSFIQKRETFFKKKYWRTRDMHAHPSC